MIRLMNAFGNGGVNVELWATCEDDARKKLQNEIPEVQNWIIILALGGNIPEGLDYEFIMDVRDIFSSESMIMPDLIRNSIRMLGMCKRLIKRTNLCDELGDSFDDALGFVPVKYSDKNSDNKNGELLNE